MSGLTSIRRRTKLQASPGRSRKAGRHSPASEHRARCDRSRAARERSPLVTVRTDAPSGPSRGQARDRPSPVVCDTIGWTRVCPSGDAAPREKLHDPFDIRRAAAALLWWLPSAAAQTAPTTAGPVPSAVIEELVLANRILNDRGVLDAYGHVSIRHPSDPEPLSDGARDRARPGDRRRHHGVRSRLQSGRPARPFVCSSSASSTARSTSRGRTSTP